MEHGVDPTLVFGGLAASGVIMGVVWLIRRTFKHFPARLAPITAVGTGLVLGFVFHFVDAIPGGGEANHTLAQSVVAGALAGFVACGAYDNGKAAVSEPEAPDVH